MRDYEFKGAVDAIMTLAAFGNTYIQTNAPWKLIKTDRAAAAQVIKNSIQIVKALAILIEPVMPDAAQRCWKMLGYDDAVAAAPDQRCHCTRYLKPASDRPPRSLSRWKTPRSPSSTPCSRNALRRRTRRRRRYPW